MPATLNASVNTVENQFQIDDKIFQCLLDNAKDRETFLSEPRTYLERKGVEFPESTEVFAYEDTFKLRHVVLPIEGTQVNVSDDLISQVIFKSLQDAAFKTELLKDPKVMAARMGIAIPDSIEVEVLANSANAIHLVLPENTANSELSDLDLELVAGGKKGGSTIGRTCQAAEGAELIGCGAGTGFGGPLGPVVTAVAEGTTLIVSAVFE